MDTTLEIELTQTGAQFTPLELRLPETLSEQSWADIGRKLLRTDHVMQWWIGDWAAFGAGNTDKDGWRKKGALKEFCEANGFDYGYARNKAWVSRSVHLSLRRDSLPPAYFQEVAPLKPKDQAKWLNKAETMSVSDIRREIRRSSAVEVGFVSDGPEIKMGSKLIDDALRWLRDKSPDFWTFERKAAWRALLQPIVTFWEGLA